MSRRNMIRNCRSSSNPLLRRAGRDFDRKHGALAGHVTVLTNAYAGLQTNVNAMIDVSNTVVRDMDELFR